MKPLTSFLRDCLWLLWMVFFCPHSFGREVEQFDRRRRWRLVAQAFVVTTVTPFFFTALAGLMLGVVGVPFDFAEHLSGMAFGVALGMAFGVALGMAFGVALGMAGGVALGMAGGVALGVALGMAGGVAFLFGYFRLFLLPVEVPTTLWALLRARRQLQQASRFLGCSLAYWDEAMLLPQPFLTRLLVLVGEQDRDALLQAAAHLTTNTFQRRAAVNALLELTRRDLLRCRTLDEIAQVQQSLGWLAPHLRAFYAIPIAAQVVSSGPVRLELILEPRQFTKASRRFLHPDQKPQLLRRDQVVCSLEMRLKRSVKAER